MTTPRDDISGLTDYLRKAAMALYLAIDQTIADELSPKIKEAATQLDALLKERDALGERVKDAESRALRAEQERDEAYERCLRAAKSAPDLNHAIRHILSLASGPEKEKTSASD